MAIPKIYTDETAAREHLEKLLWPHGPICPHCTNSDQERISKLEGKSTRPGVYKCNECRKPFSVTVGTVFERSHIPLHKWVYATHLYTASKKGFSAHQLHRTLDVTYKTAWFMAHRIRLAMSPAKLTPMGGGGKAVEIDETLIGHIEGANIKTKRQSGQFRNIVLTLVERGGSARSFHVSGTTIGQLVPIIRMNVNRESNLMTDTASWYKALGKEFASHGTVNHEMKEYGRGEITTNTVEGYYSIFKRGMKGIYQHCAEKHLHRYLSEYDFRYSYRVALGYSDAMRADKALQGISGKRLMYRGTHAQELPF
jgi:transposase-like protein